MGQVQIGFFEDFKSSDTLLIEGDTEGLRSLSAAFRRLATSRSDDVVALQDLPFVKVHRGLRVLTSCASADDGARFQNTGLVAWRRSTAGWEEAADKIDVLCGQSPGHQYLDDLSDITVQVSNGEYGAAWWQTHAQAG